MSISISAVIPVYNGEAFIKEAIESILAQTHQVNEIVIVDDGSSDNSYKIASELAVSSAVPINIFKQVNSGVSAARNLGLLKSTSTLIAFLDVDDLWSPDKIEKQVSLHIDSDDKNVFSFCDFYFNERLDQNRKFFQCPSVNKFIDNKFSKEDFQLAFINENFVGTASCIMFNRELALKINSFNAFLNHSEDFDFILRYSNHAAMKVLNEPLVLKRHHDNNLTGNLLLHFWSHLIALKINIAMQSTYTRFNYSKKVESALRFSHDVYAVKYSNELYERSIKLGMNAYMKAIFRPKSSKGLKHILSALARKIIRTVSFNRIKR